MSVYRHISNIGKQLGRPVLAANLGEKFWRIVDEFRGVGVVPEFLVADDGFQKCQIGRNPTDTELTQGAVHAQDRLFCRGCPGRHLFQKRVIKTGDDCA